MWDGNRITRIDIELTSFCNIACPGCSRENTRFREDFLNKEIISLDTIKKRFRREDWPALVGVNFCGSIDEPTSHPQFFEIIEFFKEWNININIATNGSIRTEGWWERLGKLLAGTAHMVHWGVDGIDELSEVYRVGSNFKKVEKNYRAYNKAGGRSTWQFIVMEHNEHQQELVEAKAKEEGFIATKFIWSNRKHHEKKDVSYVPVIVEETKEVSCRYLNNGYIFINHLGDVIPCCYWNAEHLEVSSPQYTPSKKESRARYVDMWLEHGGPLATNLKYNEIRDVIEGDFFDAIAESWNQTPLLDRCETMCKKGKTSVFEKKVI